MLPATWSTTLFPCLREKQFTGSESTPPQTRPCKLYSMFACTGISEVEVRNAAFAPKNATTIKHTLSYTKVIDVLRPNTSNLTQLHTPPPVTLINDLTPRTPLYGTTARRRAPRLNSTRSTGTTEVKENKPNTAV